MGTPAMLFTTTTVFSISTGQPAFFRRGYFLVVGTRGKPVRLSGVFSTTLSWTQVLGYASISAHTTTKMSFEAKIGIYGIRSSFKTAYISSCSKYHVPLTFSQHSCLVQPHQTITLLLIGFDWRFVVRSIVHQCYYDQCNSFPCQTSCYAAPPQIPRCPLLRYPPWHET